MKIFFRELFPSRLVLFEDSIPFLIPNWRVQDIDEEDDWERAEMLQQILERKESKKFH